MKRSPLNRRTPLTRKTPLRPMSAKKKQERAETDPLRRQWLDAIDKCEACGQCQAEDVHEIPAGAHRQRAVRDPRCWLGLCRHCHEQIQGMAYESQFLLLCDASRRALNRAIGRNAI